MENRIPRFRYIHTEAISSFFTALTPDAATKLRSDMVGVASEVAADVNWYLSSPTVVKTTLWEAIRKDVTVHVALIKFEQLFYTLARLEGLEKDLLSALDGMFMQGRKFAEGIVDKDFIETNNQNHSVQVISMPGVGGLMSIILFRDIWETPKAK